jgi:cytochrome P450
VREEGSANRGPKPEDDVLAPDVVRDPYGYFNALREREPVYWNDSLGAWVLTAYDDVMGAFRDPRLSADRITPYYERKLTGPNGEVHRFTYETLSRWMVFVDPPEHTRLRKLVDHAFRPKAIERMRQNVGTLVEELVDGLKQKREFDFVEDFAYPLPVLVISEMLGIPREDRDQIKHWSDAIMMLVFGALDVKDRHERARLAFTDMSAYLADILRERRKHPGVDLLSVLLAAEERGDALSEKEVIATCILLLFGGHETTTNLLANGLRALLLHDQWNLLGEQPELMPQAIEEILRWDGPSKAMWRIAKEDVSYGDKLIPSGAKLLLVQVSANRDPRKFARADAFDITREKTQHCGFGYAVHYCIGAPIARLEGSLSFKLLYAALPGLQLASDAWEWQPTVLNRSLKTLPVRVRD